MYEVLSNIDIVSLVFRLADFTFEKQISTQENWI